MIYVSRLSNQACLEKSINVQADVLRLQRKLLELSDKDKERYQAWIEGLNVAAAIYRSLAREDRRAWPSDHSRS